MEHTLTQVKVFRVSQLFFRFLQLIKNYPSCFSFILGSVGALSFPPLQQPILLIPSFCGLLFLLRDTESIRQAFIRGYIFGLGHFVVGFYWIGVAFKVVGLWYLMPFAVLGLAALLAFFPALATSLTVLWQTNTLNQVLLFSVFWSLCEWLRGHILTGFPWNLLGYACDLPLLQTTAWVGIYGLSFLTVLVVTSLVSRSKTLIISCLIGTAFLWTLGSYRLENSKTHPLTDTNLRLVQPSISQAEKWSSGLLEKHVKIHLALSHLEAEKPLAAIIWPEAAIPFLIENSQELQMIVQGAVPKDGVLLTGAPRRENTGEELKIWNSLFAISATTPLAHIYDKSHLVPFGEYIPFNSLIPLNKLTAGTLDYTPGDGIKTISLPGFPSFSPLICYEAIFPGEVVEPNKRPQWLLSLTNDAWYGHTSGPYQHLSIVSVRAIEEGLPLVRAANNGISAVIDPYGKILYSLGLDEVGFIDFTLPQVLKFPTFYSRWREIPFVFMVIAALLLSYMIRKSKRHTYFAS